ncbi:MAG: hypothetical protein U0Q16_31415 [Bryobacteraceae bacterium]
MKRILVIGLAAAGGWFLASRSGVQSRVGPQPDGSVLLNSGWSLRPAGGNSRSIHFLDEFCCVQ